MGVRKGAPEVSPDAAVMQYIKYHELMTCFREKKFRKQLSKESGGKYAGLNERKMRKTKKGWHYPLLRRNHNHCRLLSCDNRFFHRIADNRARIALHIVLAIITAVAGIGASAMLEIKAGYYECPHCKALLFQPCLNMSKAITRLQSAN